MPTSTATADRAAAILSRPFDLRGLTISNRIVMSAMTREFSPGGVPGADVARYYARRAAGGVGLIITEGTFISHDSAGNTVTAPHLYGEEPLAGWKKVVEEVHRAGGKIFAQPAHVGVQRLPGTGPFPHAQTVGPSGIGLDGSPLGKVMTQNDLDSVIASFAEAAAAAERVGFDGVEVHGAHGLLIDQFLWEGTNRRADKYGGDPVARTRFAAEVVAACRAAVSADFPIVFRHSQWKQDNYDARVATTPQELEAILTPLAEAGVDAFHSSTRRYWVPEFEGSDLNLAGWAKKVTGLPTISVGSVGLNGAFKPGFESGGQTTVAGIENLLDRLERDEFDLIAIGRALIANPEWVNKVLSGAAEDLVPFTKDQVATLR